MFKIKVSLNVTIPLPPLVGVNVADKFKLVEPKLVLNEPNVNDHQLLTTVGTTGLVAEQGTFVEQNGQFVATVTQLVRLFVMESVTLWLVTNQKLVDDASPKTHKLVVQLVVT